MRLQPHKDYLQHYIYNMNMLESVISIFAPHNCLSCGNEGQLLCRKCLKDLRAPIQSQCYVCRRSTANHSVCLSCRPHSSLNSVYIRTEYKTVAKELVQTLKFQRASAAASTIARAMTEVLPKNYQAVVVPVPTASSRRRQRVMTRQF
jgi:competence protein ComFC